MSFEMRLTHTTSLGQVTNLDGALRDFLGRVGYLREDEDTEDSVAYRLVRDLFLLNAGRAWSVDEMVSKLRTTKPTLYRHLNRLKGLGILEEVPLDESKDGARKGYRLQSGDLSMAWALAEANADIVLHRYREDVATIQRLVEAHAVEPKRRSKRRVKPSA
jgi:DNA-binding transcriptional ArsR family regulator